MYLVSSSANVRDMNAVSRGSILSYIEDTGSAVHTGGGWDVMANDRGNEIGHNSGGTQVTLQFAGTAGCVMIAKDKRSMIKGLEACPSAFWLSQDVGPIVILNGSYSASLSKSSVRRAMHQPFRAVLATIAQVKRNAKVGVWVPIKAQSHDIKRNMLQDRGYFVAVSGQSVVNSAMQGIHMHFTHQTQVESAEVLRRVR
jgi:hypothetical protein